MCRSSVHWDTRTWRADVCNKGNRRRHPVNVALSQYNHPWLIISSIHLILGAKKFFIIIIFFSTFPLFLALIDWHLDFGFLNSYCGRSLSPWHSHLSQLQSNYQQQPRHDCFPQPSVCHATLAGTAVAITQRVGIVNVMYYTASQILQYCTHDTSTLRILPFLPDPGWTFDFFTSSQGFARKAKWGNPGL